MSTTFVANEQTAERQGVTQSHTSTQKPSPLTDSLEPTSQVPKRHSVEHIEFTHRASPLVKESRPGQPHQEERASITFSRDMDLEPQEPTVASAHDVLLSIQKRTSAEAQLEDNGKQDVEMTDAKVEQDLQVIQESVERIVAEKRPRLMSLDEDVSEVSSIARQDQESTHDMDVQNNVQERDTPLVSTLSATSQPPTLPSVTATDDSQDISTAKDTSEAGTITPKDPTAQQQKRPGKSTATAKETGQGVPILPAGSEVASESSATSSGDQPAETSVTPKKMLKIYPPRKQRNRHAPIEPYGMTIRPDSALSTLASAAVAIKNHQSAMSSFSIENRPEEFAEGSRAAKAAKTDPNNSTTATASTEVTAHKPIQPKGRPTDSFAQVRPDAAGYRCDLCPGERFGRVHDLKRHQISKHNEMTWPCDFCHRPFVRRDALLRHYTVKAARNDGVHPTADEVDRLAEAKARAKLLS
ncbi:hypothetical protein BGZ94_002779 [Podila epigama]|nr:hypothetical protein BGZ94_002779 [Podila epigama]